MSSSDPPFASVRVSGLTSGITVNLYVGSNESKTLDDSQLLVRNLTLPGPNMVSGGTIIGELQPGRSYVKVQSPADIMVGGPIHVTSSSMLNVQWHENQNVYTFVFFDMKGTIQSAVARGDFFSAIVLGVSYIEQLGIQKLTDKLKEKTIAAKRLERIPLEQIVIMLYSLDVIDHPTYSKIFEVNEKRNELIHRNVGVQFLLEERELMTLVRKAEECIDALK